MIGVNDAIQAGAVAYIRERQIRNLREERMHMATFRSRAPWCERRQYTASAHFYGDEPPTADEIARALVSDAQRWFRCDVGYLIVDKVL